MPHPAHPAVVAVSKQHKSPKVQQPAARAQTPGRYSRQSFLAAEVTEAVHKLNEGRIQDLTKEDIQDLFNVLDQDNNGMLDRAEFGLFLMEALRPPCSEGEVEAIFSFSDQRPDGMITSDELFRAFKSPAIRLQLQHLQTKFKVKKEFDESQGANAEVQRELLVERLDWRLRRDDAFASLPFSSLITLLFLLFVVCHLQIWRRQHVERGLEAWITGYGTGLPGPYLEQAVAGTTSLWDWLASSGVSSVFGDCRDNSAGQPFCHLASRHVLLGDVQLWQARGDGAERSEWLLHAAPSEGGARRPEVQAHLAAAPGDFLGAAKVTLEHLQSSDWMDEETDALHLSFSTYNSRAKVFALTDVSVAFGDYGYVQPRVVASSVVMDPYSSKAYFALDALYLCAVIYPLYSELKDIWSFCRGLGCVKGLAAYSGFWNLVDWMTIGISVLQSICWVLCCLAMQAESLQDMLEGDVPKGTLSPRVMQLGSGALDAVRADLAHVVRLFFWLHLVMTANVFFIMLKFFKAFQANPKLQLVTHTLTSAAGDIFHFLVVASTVFIGFSLIGHIVFGGDIVAFSSFPRSMNTAFTVLMGDFDWYSQESVSDVSLASGVPYLLLSLWFWLFMVLNFLVLLNMLMAIILDHYNDCFEQVKQDPEARALWVQAWGYLKRSWKTQGFIPLSTLLCRLLDEEQPAHQGELVTYDSLMEEFSMTAEQADFLMKWLKKEAKIRQIRSEGGEDKTLARMRQVEGFMEGMAEMLHILSLNVSQCSSTLRELGHLGLQGGSSVEERAGQLDVDEHAEFADQMQRQDNSMQQLGRVAGVLREVLAHVGLPAQPNLPGVQFPQSVLGPPPSSKAPSVLGSLPASCCSISRAQRGAPLAGS